jgi:hypothetical protein
MGVKNVIVDSRNACWLKNVKTEMEILVLNINGKSLSAAWPVTLLCLLCRLGRDGIPDMVMGAERRPFLLRRNVNHCGWE